MCSGEGVRYAVVRCGVAVRCAVVREVCSDEGVRQSI